MAAAQGTEQVVLVVRWRAHGQEVVFTRLSFFHVWTLERTSDILVWLEPKIFFISSITHPARFTLTSCKIIELILTHVLSSLLSIYGTDFTS